MAEEKIIEHPVYRTFTWYAKCGKSEGGFKTRNEARAALGVHKIGCRTC